MGSSLTAAATKAMHSLENSSSEGAERIENMNPLDARLALLDEKVGLYVERFGVTEGELGNLHKRIRAARKGLDDKTKVADEAERMLTDKQFETRIETDAKDPLLKEKVETAFSLIQHIRKNKQEKLETIGVERAGEFVTDAKLLTVIKKDPAVWQSIKLRAAEGSSVAKAFQDPAVRLDTPEGRATYAEATGQDAEKAWGWVKEHKVATAAIVLGGIAVLSWLMSSKKDPAESGEKKESSSLPWIAGLGAVGLGLAAWQMDRVEGGIKKAEEIADAAKQKASMAVDVVKGAGKKVGETKDRIIGKKKLNLEAIKDPYDRQTAERAEQLQELDDQGLAQSVTYKTLRELSKPGILNNLREHIGRTGYMVSKSEIDGYLERLDKNPPDILSSDEITNCMEGIMYAKGLTYAVGGAAGILSLGASFAMQLAQDELDFLSSLGKFALTGQTEHAKEAGRQYVEGAIYVAGAATMYEVVAHALTPHHTIGLAITKGIVKGLAWPVFGLGMVAEGAARSARFLGKPKLLGHFEVVGKFLHAVDVSGQFIAKYALPKSLRSIAPVVPENAASQPTAESAEKFANATQKIDAVQRELGDKLTHTIKPAELAHLDEVARAQRLGEVARELLVSETEVNARVQATMTSLRGADLPEAELQQVLKKLDAEVIKPFTDAKLKNIIALNQVYADLPAHVRTPELASVLKSAIRGPDSTLLTRLKVSAKGRLKIMGLMAMFVAGTEYFTSPADRELADTMSHLGPELMQIFVDVLPFVGTASSAYSTATGKTFVTEAETSRLASGAFTVAGGIADVLTVMSFGTGVPVNIAARILVITAKMGPRGKALAEAAMKVLPVFTNLAEKMGGWSEFAKKFVQFASNPKLMNRAALGATAVGVGAIALPAAYKYAVGETDLHPDLVGA